MSRPHDISSSQAARELARVGAAAMPAVDEIAPVHLHAIDEAIRAMALPTAPTVAMARRAGRPALQRRRIVVACAAAALVALPSMAVAGVLPDSVQHAAANVAANVGFDLPDPASDRAEQATSERGTQGTGDSAGESNAQDDTGNGLGADTRGTVPGKPEPGEVRGNRFGQVEGGPDQGKAGAAQAAHPPGSTTPPPTSQRPASPPGQSADHGDDTSSGGASTSPSSNAGGNREHDTVPGAHGKGH
jgi:hypothetical protein